jgi:DNA-binding NarL/FixJ family response regulator
MGSVKLFLVEDQSLTREAFARAFSATDKYEVVGQSADTGELLGNPATWKADVIILDMVLSKYASFDAIQKLRNSGVKSPILILSNNGDSSALQAALNAGAQGFVPKQSGFTEMESAIEAVASGKTYVSPNVKAKDYNNQEDCVVPWVNGTSQDLLSKREHEIFLMLAQGKKNRDIGKLLSISTRTVDTHRANILKKLQMRSNAELVRMAISEGLINV